MAVKTSAQSTLDVSASLPASPYGSTQYAAVAWSATTLVGEITDMGEVGGKTFNVTNHSPMGSARVQKLKGTYNPGTMTLQMGRDAADAGQILLRAANDSYANYAFRVTLQGGNKLYFMGKVTDLKTNIGNADQVTGLTVTIEIDSDVVEATS
jgi:hypothetical protein